MSWNFGEKLRSGTETAFDACDYFVDEVHEMESSLDNTKKIRLLKYKELREAVLSGNERNVKVLLNALGTEKEIIVNIAPVGANTLLFLACQTGLESIVELLINAGADGRLHPVTRYSPLYASCHHGQYGATKIVLNKLPHLIQQMTVERWLPIHAACINGHVNILNLLKNFNYPENLYINYRDESNTWEWKLTFDPNHQDVTGQTSLYIASILGNVQLVKSLLSWKVKCKSICENINTESPITPNRKRISLGIQAILSKLNISEQAGVDKIEFEQRCPVNVNLLCGAARETSLLAAVRGGFLNVADLLLQNGADTNIIAKPVEDQNDPKCSEEIYGLSNTPLAEACKQNSVAMVDLLLKYGATDMNAAALEIAIINKNEDIISRLLAKRAHPDSDFKINKKLLSEKYMMIPSTSNLTYSKLFPNTPAAINWHNTNVQLSFIKFQWIINAALQLNSKLQFNPKVDQIALTAITRIDISHNALKSLPAEIFSLGSLRYLNIAQNKIEHLPCSKINDQNQKICSVYTCPVLEEILLQDNRLVSIPAEIFHLPLLSILDISNNKIQQLPFEIWKSPKLRELNVAFNLLKDLPLYPISDANDIIKVLTTVEANFKHPPLATQNSQAWRQHILKHQNIWSETLDVTGSDIKWSDQDQDFGICQLNCLNIANNLFTSIPVALPCLAINLTRLNMSYNSLRSMGHVTSYPSSLKHIDLSHNEITCWPSLPRIAESDPYLRCYNPQTNLNYEKQTETDTKTHMVAGNSFRNTVLKSVCKHRKHLRLESLRTLILADNLLSRIQLSTDDVTTVSGSDDSEWSVVGICKSKLLFPNLSMLDISNNCLKEIPNTLHELTSLSVLNISGNVDITDLPPKLGLLSRLWNLNTRGCLLQEPLRSMIESKKYKTMDIIGYLKSIYEDAQSYTRMKLMVVGIQGIGKTTLLDLLKQGGIHKGRSNTDHWARRMGHKTSFTRTTKGMNMSTVGVDIGTWICDKRRRNTASGPIIFRTWDFGGQKEYYATHQYFLSKRSLYLVLWRITDGQKGLAEVLQWLGNIQARAPNSPVIIVGTHFDEVGEKISARRAEELQQIIREKFIAIPDAEKEGLPRIMDTIEISCRTLHNVKLLSNIIYDTAFLLRSPGSKQPLLLQKVPATYIALEDVINTISNNLKSSNLDPVLDGENYKNLVTEEMRVHGYKAFRDTAELNQATMFLHDNGVILHYDDATLRDFYFLDPQWLCDMLAHVVTVREINPFVKNGLMKLENLQLIFKNSTSDKTDTRSYIVNLLNKFEVALTWDSRTLLIPSLLPVFEASTEGEFTKIKVYQKLKCPGTQKVLASGSQEMFNFQFESQKCEESYNVIRRLLLMTYFPSGFWSRLITRLLADDRIVHAVKQTYEIKIQTNSSMDINNFLENELYWSLWQTGLSLYLGSTLVLKIWEVPFSSKFNLRSSKNKFMLKVDGLWTCINVSTSSILEILFPLSKVEVSKISKTGEKEFMHILEPSYFVMAKLLAILVDHVDILLEDWYPSLGTRFVHTSEGRFLITRLVVCPNCFKKIEEVTNEYDTLQLNQNLKKMDYTEDFTSNMFSAYLQNEGKTISKDLNLSDTDSGLDQDSTESSRNTSVDSATSSQIIENIITCYSWMVEECILCVYNDGKIICPLHSEIYMSKVAPDVIFADIPEKFKVSPDKVKKGALLGRGAFGFVFKGMCKTLDSKNFRPVAMKMLQPVAPGPKAQESAILAYKIAVGKWDRDPLQYSCKAYCTARQELSVLSTLNHSNIIPLVGVCVKPLALILELAPLGALDSILRQYRRSGARITTHTFQKMALQAARAIEYLHRKKIIYRDLKSENVLVWEFPFPHINEGQNCHVHLKIADYGISRTMSYNGSKGFAGTEGFIAPEIIRYNGEEEYTEKVDCFSFGMFLYEIITLRQPFEGQESIKDCILEGTRPTLTLRETNFPTYCLDLMVLCWDEQPKKRPSASQLVSILSAPEVIHLLDVVILSHRKNISCGEFVRLICSEDESVGYELWLPHSNFCIDILEASTYFFWTQYRTLLCENKIKNPEIKNILFNEQRKELKILSSCTVQNFIWFGDSSGNLHVFSTMNYSHIFSYILDISLKSPVINLAFLEKINRVSVGLLNGRMFLVDANKIPVSFVSAEGTFLLTEFQAGNILYSVCTVLRENVYEIWCGGDSQVINIFTTNESAVLDHTMIKHLNNENNKKLKVFRLHSTEKWIFSCLNPGFTVFQWDIQSKEILNRLDCSKLLPCSESLQSISLEEPLMPLVCQISAIAVHGMEIYIGTSWGCLIVADASSLRPITVFRPYENEIKAIIPFPNQDVPIVATIGYRYRSLIDRYLNKTEQNKLSSHGLEKNQANNISCLLWKAKDCVYEIWCGGDSQVINIFTTNESAVLDHTMIKHLNNENNKKLKVFRLHSTEKWIFSCLNPGFTVFQWDIQSKEILNRLDCSKLLPCSESLQSISLEEPLMPLVCQISAIAVHGMEIYIGTSWGCLIVADASSLRPITVFRPYENEIKAIIPFPNQDVPIVATIGYRYRSLIDRYLNKTEQNKLSSHGLEKNQANNISCLLWKAKDW